MNKSKFKRMKVFDCQDMPEETKKIFFELARGEHSGNDHYVDWCVHSEVFFYEEGQKEDPEYCEYVRQKTLLDDWFIQNGALAAIDDKHEGEHIIVKYWW